MWIWVFSGIAALGAAWHVWLIVKIANKSKLLLVAAKPLVTKLSASATGLGQKPVIQKPKRAVDEPMERVLVERLKIIRQRRAAKAERQRRLISSLKKIDPTERRFTRVRKRS
jgi:hypothetical protein